MVSRKLTSNRLTIHKILKDDLFGNIIIEKYKNNNLSQQILSSIWRSLNSFSLYKGFAIARLRGNYKDLSIVNRLYLKKAVKSFNMLSRYAKSYRAALLLQKYHLKAKLSAFRKRRLKRRRLIRRIKKIILFVHKKQVRRNTKIVKNKQLQQKRYYKKGKSFRPFSKKSKPPWGRFGRRRFPRAVWQARLKRIKGYKLYRRNLWLLPIKRSVAIEHKSLHRLRFEIKRARRFHALKKFVYYRFWDSRSYFAKRRISRLKERVQADKYRNLKSRKPVVFKYGPIAAIKQRYLRPDTMVRLRDMRIQQYFTAPSNNTSVGQSGAIGSMYSLFKKSNRPILENLEFRLPTLLIRANFSQTPYVLKQLVKRGFFSINGVTANSRSLELHSWDVITFSEAGKWLYYALIYKRLIRARMNKSKFPKKIAFVKRLFKLVIRRRSWKRERLASRLFSYIDVPRVSYKKKPWRSNWKFNDKRKHKAKRKWIEPLLPKRSLKIKRKRISSLLFPLTPYPNYFELSYSLPTMIVLGRVKSADINLPFGFRDISKAVVVSQKLNRYFWKE